MKETHTETQRQTQRTSHGEGGAAAHGAAKCAFFAGFWMVVRRHAERARAFQLFPERAGGARRQAAFALQLLGGGVLCVARVAEVRRAEAVVPEKDKGNVNNQPAATMHTHTHTHTPRRLLTVLGSSKTGTSTRCGRCRAFRTTTPVSTARTAGTAAPLVEVPARRRRRTPHGLQSTATRT